MNTDARLEQRVADALNRAASTREPDGLLDSVLSTVGRTRARPRWLALIKEPPMHLHARVAVGSPAVRLAYLAILTLLMTILATGAVVAGASLLPTPAIVVAQDGSGTYRTINEAVAVAQDGDTVMVKPGTYLESVAITEDITLRGDGDRKDVIIEFATDGPTHLLDDGPIAYGILLNDTDARVQNLTLRGHPKKDDMGLSAVVIDAGSPVVEQLDIILDDEPYPDYAWAARSAFQVYGGSTATVRDSSWDGFTRIIGSPTFEGNAISAQRVSTWDGESTIVGNTLTDGAILLWTGAGAGGVAEDNHIIDGLISIGDGAHPVVRRNEIRQPRIADAITGDPGAAIQIGLGTPIVEDNTISDSQSGIALEIGAKPQINSNTIRGSVNAAIFVDVAADPAITGNLIERNTTGVEVVGTSSPELTNNKFCGNVTDLKVPEGSTLTLEGNTVCNGAASAAP